MKKDTKSQYYDNTDFFGLIKEGKGKVKGATKRITMNISDTIYEEANELDSYMQMGYQNVLKTAITIGLSELYNQVSKHTVTATVKTRATPSWRPRSIKTAGKSKSHIAQG